MSTPLESIHEFKSVDPRNIRLQTYISLIVSAILITGWLIGLFVTFLTTGLSLATYLVAGIGLLVAVLLLVLSLVWPGVSHRRTSYRFDELGLQIRRGVFFQHQISVPTARVQHADVSQGPFQRQFDLGTLTVHTAGTSNASVELDGLPHGEALRLRDNIVKQRKAIDVV